MLAHHPLTGKEIRVVTTEASVWKERKTILFSHQSEVYDTVHTQGRPTFRIVLENTSLQTLLAFSRFSKILFVAKSVIDTIGVKEIQNSGVSNIVCLEEMGQLFPHLGQPWNGSLEDAVTLIAGLLRYRYVKGIPLTQRAQICNLQEDQEEKKELWWVTQYYVAGKAKRRRENEKCLTTNVNSKLISRIILLNEKKEFLPVTSDKIEERVIGHRLTYKDIIEAAGTFPENVIVVFANADICIDDESWKQLWSLNLSRKILALLRYDVPESGDLKEAKLFGPRADSQDTWVALASDLKGMNTKTLDIPFGKAGCDNAIAMEFLRQRFMVSNPSHTLKTWHYHSSQVRNYNPQDIVDRPAFLYVLPTGIHDLDPVLASISENKPFVLEDCFQTEHGLVFDRTKMYIGKSEEAQKTWSSAQIHGLTPTVECKRGLAIPFTPADMESREQYILNVVSKVAALRANYPEFRDAEWFCPEKKEFVEALQIFKWNSSEEQGKKIPVIRWEPQVHIWCRNALALPVGSRKLTSESVDWLRKTSYSWEESITESKRIIIWEDEKVFTEELVQSIEEVLDEKGWDVRVLYPGRSSVERICETLRGAWGVIQCSSVETSSWNWLLPKGATVITNTSNEINALAELNEIVLKNISHKGVVEQVSSEESNLLTIWMPRKSIEGYFAHAGDSFREMANLWAEKGYCRVKEHPTAVQVWWGKVGEVLLYDRPNHDWRLAAPMEERSWKYALFGNPRIPLNTSNTSSWFFWPRRPALVEERVSQGLPSWDERAKGIVFYGKIENKVQERRRTNVNWPSTCSSPEDEWVMVRGEEKYPFTQAEYLNNLAQAKFGLCLAGYGYKCHREVECMAMGCVPLVAPECDMDSYIDPPVEGKHYIRVKSPEEAREVAKTMSKETWEELSQNCQIWWKKNCSVEGSFRLTENKIASL